MGKRGKRGKKKFHCPECSVPFETKRSLNNHRKVHVPKAEAKLPPTRPSNNEQNRFRKESATEADHLSKLPLWGTPGRDTSILGLSMSTVSHLQKASKILQLLERNISRSSRCTWIWSSLGGWRMSMWTKPW